MPNLDYFGMRYQRWESKGPGPKGPESKGPRSIRWTDHVSTQSTIGTSEHSFKSVDEGR